VVNVATREKTRLRLPSGGQLADWAFDGKGRLRAVTLSSSAFWRDSTTLTHWYRGPTADNWMQLDSYPVTDDGWRPLAASTDSDELLVASRQGRDTSAIFAYDPIRGQRGEVLASHPREDIVGLEDPRGNEHASVVTMGMKPVRHWFDGRWAGLQKAVDSALPGRMNVLSGQSRGLVLVFSYADVDPGRWFTLDTRTMAMRPVFEARPDIVPARMRPMESISYPAPDGLAVPAYLTRPAGAGPHPLVVMVHGGPAVRDHWEWDADVQLLAARGFAVFQPQFRGSTGFGRRFERAGDGQWGLLMQDDISEGVRHLVRTGVADPRRVCIYGASYGGYAAVWGLIKTPDLYRCGVALAGVTDINHLFSDWNDVGKIGREIWRFRIGDRERDRARFDSVSPLLRAGDIRAPLLIAHGELDERVPIGHARRLMKAMDAHGRPYQWLPLPYADHSLADLPSRGLFTMELLAFIDRHIGRGPTP
jgi:dipeptidyl aminopeptidase/acylaminoacyl peptidase